MEKNNPVQCWQAASASFSRLIGSMVNNYSFRFSAVKQSGMPQHVASTNPTVVCPTCRTPDASDFMEVMANHLSQIARAHHGDV